MKFTAIFALVASTQAVHLTSTQKVEIKAQAETMNQAMLDISAQMEESQKTLNELQEKFDLFNPSSWWSIKSSIHPGLTWSLNKLVKKMHRASEHWSIQNRPILKKYEKSVLTILFRALYFIFCAIIILYPNKQQTSFFNSDYINLT